jgi:hypothetical protein
MFYLQFSQIFITMERNIEDRMARLLSNADKSESSDTDSTSIFPEFSAFFHPSDMVKDKQSDVARIPRAFRESPRRHGKIRTATSQTCEDIRGGKLYHVPGGLEISTSAMLRQPSASFWFWYSLLAASGLLKAVTDRVML